MSHAIPASGPWDDGFRRSPLAMRLGHHARVVLVLSVGAVIAIELNRPTPVMILAAVAMFGVVVGSLVLVRGHDRRLCEACVAVMPLDPARQAERYHRRFWVSHTGSQPRFLVPYLIVLVGSNLLTGSTAGRIVWLIVQSSMLYLVLAQATHRRLQPWCPWCRSGGDGQHDHETPPVIPQDDRLPV